MYFPSVSHGRYMRLATGFLQGATVASLVTVVLAGATFGQRVVDGGTNSSAKPRNEQTKSTEGTILRAGSLVGHQLQTSDGKPAGMVKDMILDLDAGQVPFIVIALDRDANGQPGSIAVPMNQVHDLAAAGQHSLAISSSDLTAAPRLDKSAKLSREWAVKQLQAFKQEPSWDTKNEELKPGDEFARLSALRDQEVRNGKGTLLGKIRDFAVTDRGEVAYAGLAEADDADRLYPVPLSALVVPEKAGAWLIELPAEILEKTPTFTANQWPTTLDRGWVEYVNVRYGRSVFSGVNHQPHNKAADDKSAAAKD